MTHIPGVHDPLARPYPWYVLLELSSSLAGRGLRQALDDFLAAALDEGLVADGAIAQSAAQARDLWRIREGMVEAQKPTAAASSTTSPCR